MLENYTWGCRQRWLRFSKELKDLLHDSIMSENLRVNRHKSQKLVLEALLVYTLY